MQISIFIPDVEIYTRLWDRESLLYTIRHIFTVSFKNESQYQTIMSKSVPNFGTKRLENRMDLTPAGDRVQALHLRGRGGGQVSQYSTFPKKA